MSSNDSTNSSNLPTTTTITNRYPTMMLKRFGKLYEFDGPPEAKDIVRYMRKATEPALHVRGAAWRSFIAPIMFALLAQPC